MQRRASSSEPTQSSSIHYVLWIKKAFSDHKHGISQFFTDRTYRDHESKTEKIGINLLFEKRNRLAEAYGKGVYQEKVYGNIYKYMDQIYFVKFMERQKRIAIINEQNQAIKYIPKG